MRFEPEMLETCILETNLWRVPFHIMHCGRELAEDCLEQQHKETQLHGTSKVSSSETLRFAGPHHVRPMSAFCH